MTWLMVFLGGGVGAIMRFGVSKLTQKIPAPYFPVGTLLSNILASFMVGAIGIIILKMKPEQAALYYAFWIIGVCGGFSTFSTFAKENLDLMEQGKYLIAGLNILISVGLTVFMVYGGRKWVG